MRTFLSRLLDLVLRRSRERRLDDELQAHLDLLADDYVARGLSPDEAALAARKAFGGVVQLKERYRDQRGLPLLDWLMQDLRFAFRLMRKHPLFSITAAGSLALSIGALTLAFSVVNGIVFKPLPVADPERVYFMQNGNVGWSYPDYRDLRDRLDVDALAGYRITMMSVGLKPEAAILWGYLVTGNYFEALGVTPAAGRFFAAADDTRPGDAPLAVLAYDTWQSRFGGRADIVGSTITINGGAFTVTGVAPKGFYGTEVFYRPEIWVPMMMQAQIELGSSWLDRRVTQNVMAVVRLSPGVRKQQGEAAIAAAVAQLSEEHPRNGPLQLRLTRPGLLGDNIGGPARVFAWGLFGLGALLMLAACSNIAGLLLARGNDRMREIALRTALGAGAGRIARQLLTESLLLAVCGGVAGALIAIAGTRLFSAFRFPTELPFQVDLTADAAVLTFAIGVSIVVGIAVGTAPARFASRLDLNRSLKSADGVRIAGRRLQGRELLVCLQVAFCVVLLHASLLAVRGLQRAATASIGWNPDGIVMVATELGLARYTKPQADAYRDRILADARSLPGVVSATVSNSLPLHLDQSSTTVFGYSAAEPARGVSATTYEVAPAFFATLQIPLRDGRDFTAFDSADVARVAIVNRTLAERLFGGREAVGQQIREGRGGAPTRVIGIVDDGKYVALSEGRRPALFRPLAQVYANSSMLIIRAARPGLVRVEDLRQLIQRVDANLPIRSSATGEQLTALPLFPYRAAVTALGLLGAIASALLLSGLHAMVAYAVAKRHREIGIRMALGADSAGVMRAMLSRVFVILGIGMTFGALLASGTGPLVSSMVLGGSPREPVLIVTIAAVLAAIALVSCAGPVRRSLSVDPLVALRED